MWPLLILGRILNVSWGWLSGCCAHFLRKSWDVSSVSWNVSRLRSVLECVLWLCPCVSEIVLKMCSQGVLECVLGTCPQSVLAVSARVSSSLTCTHSRVVTGCVLGVLGSVAFGYHVFSVSGNVCPQSLSSGCLGVCPRGVLEWCPGVCPRVASL